MSPDPAAQVEAYWERVEAGDVDGAADLFTEDVEFVLPSPVAGYQHVAGRAELREYFEAVDAGQVEHRIDETVVEGDRAAVIGTATYVESGRTSHFCALVELDGDRIARYSVTNR